MSKIRIVNFGPIKSGFSENGGWIDIKRVTVLIGNQGSGKSTIAKLISTFTWIEKALVRGELKDTDIESRGKFIKQFTYQNIGTYFSEDTDLEYFGEAFHISFNRDFIFVREITGNRYHYPKIMYVPAERNFVSAVSNVNALKGLPSTLYTFSDEYLNAVNEIKGQIVLPINDAKFEYQKLNKLSWVVGPGYKVKLSAASSGFQSVVPLYIVTKYLSESLTGRSDNSSRATSIDESRRIRRELEAILYNPKLSDEIKATSLEILSAKITPSAFINIVEEPEQNLFPTSQHKVLNSLVSYNNSNETNKLILTTHSPYLINYLAIAIKAKMLEQKISDSNLRSQLYSIVPSDAMINREDLVVLECNEINGVICPLKTYQGIPSDDNKLNQELGHTNDLFSKLFELEQRI